MFKYIIYQTLAINVDIPLSVYEFARGDPAIIPCNFKPKNPVNSVIIISWMAHADVESDPELNIATLYYSETVPPSLDYGEAYNGRAALNYSISQGIATLTLNAITSKDSRVYECKVQIPKDTTGKQVDSTRLVVLVAPSKPICTIQGKAEFYQNISLACHSEEGTPTPTYQWTSYDLTNKSRPNPPKSTDVNGVLSLYNISTETNGFFICTSSNKIRSNFCNLTLTVVPSSMNVAPIAGIIGGIVAVLLILLVVVYCCCCRRKQAKHEEYAMGPSEETEYTDKEPHEIVENKGERMKSNPAMSEDTANRRDHYEDRSEQDYDRSRDRYSDRRDDYDDRRESLDDRRSNRYDDRRNDRYDDYRDQYDEDRDRYDDHRSERHDRYDDRYDDHRDRHNYRDDRSYDRDRPPNVPANKPSRG
ncbi:hypothetical protein P4O66_021460 [Electrophorus voltai]|uniref:Ig-like domain-containing protein n=1 Tax=Electrophorus voltai TaxID=2609070 RepID=A0AAD8ZP75_9TELE|nr:hypothetical protein P4O66_021460 [Electrophorus voltai]